MFSKRKEIVQYEKSERKSISMRSWQIALGFVAVFTVGFYFGLQQQSGLEQSGLEALLSPSAIQSEGDAASIIAKDTVPDISGISSTKLKVEPIAKLLTPISTKECNEKMECNVKIETAPIRVPNVEPILPDTDDKSDDSSSYDELGDASEDESIDEENSEHYADESEELDYDESEEKPEEPEKEPTEEISSYNAAEEQKNRRAQLVKSCANRRHNLMSVSYRTGLVSRWGVSTGGVNFFTCFLPKAASSSMSAAMLLATGWINKSQRNDITDRMWDDGRNHCSGRDAKCLKDFSQMPQKYRYMGENLAPGDDFVSLVVAREPMERLISAWKDKIYRRTGRQFYYDRYTSSMLKYMGKTWCPSKEDEAWDKGCRVEFKDFVRWIAAGNRAADEHWTPAVDLCVACQGNYSFIGHSEHFNEDIMVAAKLLKIDPAVLPDNYKHVNLHAAKDNADAASKPKTVEEMFADVPKSSLRQIRQIYQADYDTFSYPMPEWLKNA